MELGTWKEENIRIFTSDGEITMEQIVKTYGNPDYRVDRRKQRKNGAADPGNESTAAAQRPQ